MLLLWHQAIVCMIASVPVKQSRRIWVKSSGAQPYQNTTNHKPMMTSSNGNIFRVTGPLGGEFTGPGEFPTQRPVTRSFDVFFDLCLNKRLSKQPLGWWFETPPWSLWRHCNASAYFFVHSESVFIINLCLILSVRTESVCHQNLGSCC